MADSLTEAPEGYHAAITYCARYSILHRDRVVELLNDTIMNMREMPQITSSYTSGFIVVREEGGLRVWVDPEMEFHK